MKKNFLFNLFLVMIIMISSLFGVSGCFKDDSKDEKISVTDITGYTLSIDKPVERIVSLWPSGSQLLITLGLGDLLVGVSNDTKEQPWAVHMYPRLSEIPGCDYKESAEQIYNLEPDVVLTSEKDVAESLREKGLKAITFGYYSIEEMKTTITALSKIVSKPYSTNLINYISYLDNNIKMVKDALENKVIDKEVLYYINGNNNKGLTKTAGANTMNEEWVVNAFCEFATSSLLGSSETVVDEEAILYKNPSIIVIGGRYQHVLEQTLMNDSKWSNVSAVKNNRVYKAPLGISPFDRFGAEIALMIPWVASVVYEEHFSYDILNQVKNFYKNFTNFDLTDETAAYIVNGEMPDGTQEFN